jgi:exopolyphosphatase/guanosine-5'-triphosphate,3'-diphosphate pyrophosphatase
MRLGVIDIGYNAIRASVYEDNSIGASEIFNTKFKNDILNLITNENLDIKHQTYLCLQYILHIFKQTDVSTIKCVATAVLRDHPRATDFTNFIKDKYGIEIEIVSGEKEAKLSAIGLITATNNVDGIAADLGGGSLELIEIKKNTIGKLKSLELGTKVINLRNMAEIDLVTNLIREEYGTDTYENLYFIGGALRFICRLYIEIANYPLNNLHNLMISKQDFLNYLDRIQEPNGFIRTNRTRINANAILVARAMIEVFEPNNIFVSTFGLKEGIRLDYIPEEERKKDLVLEKVLRISNFDNSKTNFEKYYNNLKPLIANEDDYFYITKLSICLSYLSKYSDQTLSPKAISDYILSSEIQFQHKDRIMLALVLSYITNFKPDGNIIRISKKLLSKKDCFVCQIIAHYIRIAKEIDGPLFTYPSFDILIHNQFLEINSKEILPRTVFEKVCARLKLIAFARRMISNDKHTRNSSEDRI